MPIGSSATDKETVISYHNHQRNLRDMPVEVNGDRTMSVRPRKSRIYDLRKFLDYPITLTPDTLRKLGMFRTVGVAASYFAYVLIRARLSATWKISSLIASDENATHIFQVLYGKSVERPLRRDKCRVGRAEDQVALAWQGRSSFCRMKVDTVSQGLMLPRTS